MGDSHQPLTAFCMTNYFIYHETLARSCERAMLAWTNSWISDRLDRMSKQGDSPNYECGIYIVHCEAFFTLIRKQFPVKKKPPTAFIQ